MKKLPTGTTLVLPAVDMVMGILDRMEIFAAQPGRELFAEMLAYKPVPQDNVQGINRVSVAELVTAIYLDLLQETSKWAKIAGYVNHTEKQWTRMVRGWDDNVDQKLENQLFADVIQEAYEDIHDWVLEFDDGDPTWHVWYVRRLGFDILLEKGPDYRILDWERRMKAGADYIKGQEAGETMPSEAWFPDDEGRRFAELLTQQQKEASPLGKSSIDEMDGVQKKARARARLRQAGRQGFRRSGPGSL
jgi:hypothetical protein